VAREAGGDQLSPPGAASHRDRWLGPIALAVVLVSSALALRIGRPPAPVPATAPDSAFSAERAMAHVRAIAAVPRPVGTAAHDRARDYVVAALASFGLEPEVQTATALIERGGRARGATVQNVVARIRGTGTGRAVALVSHYDSQVLTPGAADAASGVAAVLEAVRVLQRGPPLGNDVIVLITDAEEPGLLGAEAFVAEHRWADDVALVLNFEARGSGGPSLMFETGPRNGRRLRAYAAHDPYPVGSSLSYEVYRRLPNDTDFSVFRRAGIAGLNFAFIDDAHTYHQAFDVPRNLSRASLQHHGEHAVAMARYFGSVDLSETDGPDAVWFDFPGLGLVVYSAALAIPLAGAAVLVLLGLGVWGLRSRRLRVRDLVAGLLAAPLGLILANRGAHLLMWHLYPLHAEHDLLQGRAQYVEGWYLLALVALAWIPVAGLWILARRWFRAGGTALGAFVVPASLAMYTAVAVPGASMLLLWPTLGALAGVYYLLRREPMPVGPGGVLLLAVLAIPGIALLVPLLHLVFVALNIEFAPYLAAIAGLTIVLLYPLLDAVRRPNWWWSLAAAAGLCVLFVTAGLLSRGATEEHPAPTSLLYALDADSGLARWATGMEVSDAWTGSAVPDDAEWITLERFLPGLHREFRAAPAPVVSVPVSAIETLADDTADGRRRLTVALRSEEPAPYFRLRATDQPHVRLAAVNGRELEGRGESGIDLDYFGAPEGGIVVTLETSAPAEAIVLDLLAHRYGLPSVPGVTRERPPTLFPVADHWSDRTIVRQRIVIPGE